MFKQRAPGLRVSSCHGLRLNVQGVIIYRADMSFWVESGGAAYKYGIQRAQRATHCDDDKYWDGADGEKKLTNRH